MIISIHLILHDRKIQLCYALWHATFFSRCSLTQPNGNCVFQNAARKAFTGCGESALCRSKHAVNAYSLDEVTTWRRSMGSMTLVARHYEIPSMMPSGRDTKYARVREHLQHYV